MRQCWVNSVATYCGISWHYWHEGQYSDWCKHTQTMWSFWCKIHTLMLRPDWGEQHTTRYANINVFFLIKKMTTKWLIKGCWLNVFPNETQFKTDLGDEYNTEVEQKSWTPQAECSRAMTQGCLPFVSSVHLRRSFTQTYTLRSLYSVAM